MQDRTLIFLAVLVNLLLSYLMLLYNQPINTDGIIYIHCAQVYLQSGLHSAMHVYPWPLYSILLAKTSQLLNISMLNAGFFINSFFTSILVIFFLLTVRLLEESPKVLLWAAAVILLLPELNHDRYNLLRDIPYYALFMCSLWSYIKFLQTEKFAYALVFTLVIILATLFRVEGAVFLVLVPLITVLVKCDFKLLLINLLLFVIGLFFFRHSLDFGRIPEIVADANPSQLFGLLQQKTILLKQYLGVYGQDDSGVFLTGGLAGLFVVYFLTTFGIFSSLLLGYGVYTKSLPKNKSVLQGIVIYILINIIILSVFLAHQLFMNWRYIFPLVLTCLLFIPGILARLDKRWIAFGYLLFNTGSSFGQFGPSNSYLVDAGHWISNNTPATTKIYTTDDSVVFYANRNRDNTVNKGDYVVVVSKDHLITLLPPNTPALVTFRNNRGDMAYIYKN
jgi:hypothetical protein